MDDDRFPFRMCLVVDDECPRSWRRIGSLRCVDDKRLARSPECHGFIVPTASIHRLVDWMIGGAR